MLTVLYDTRVCRRMPPNSKKELVRLAVRVAACVPMRAGRPFVSLPRSGPVRSRVSVCVGVCRVGSLPGMACPEEHFCGKTAALLVKGTPRLVYMAGACLRVCKLYPSSASSLRGASATLRLDELGAVLSLA